MNGVAEVSQPACKNEMYNLTLSTHIITIYQASERESQG